MKLEFNVKSLPSQSCKLGNDNSYTHQFGVLGCTKYRNKWKHFSSVTLHVFRREKNKQASCF